MLHFTITSRPSGKLRQLADTLHDDLAQAAQDTAEAIRDDAKTRAPVRTGFLRDSIHTERTGDALVWEVIAGAPYALYVEYGTSRMRAQPFMTPAVEQHRATLRRQCRAALRGTR